MSYSVITNYQTTLSAPMTSTQLTVPVNSIVTRDKVPHTIVTADMGEGWYLTTAPGTADEEIIEVTAVTPSGTGGIFTVPTLGRGLAYYGPTDAQGVGNARPHNPGDIVILSNVKNVYDRMVDKESDETINGVKIFTESPIVPNPTTALQAANKDYVDNVAVAGAPDASTTVKGIVEEATQAEIAAGTAAGATLARLFTNPSTLAANIQAGSWLYAVEDGTGSDDAYTAALTPVLTAYTAGQLLAIKFTVANTAACTLDINTLGAKAIKKYVLGAKADIETGDIVANYVGLLEYDGTDMVLLSMTATMPTTATFQSLTTNLPTLVGGVNSNADPVHTHANLYGAQDSFIGQTATLFKAVSGFSDATPKLFSYGYASTSTSINYKALAIASDYGSVLYTKNAPATTTIASVAGGRGLVVIGTSIWASDDNATAGNRIRKAGSAVTISGTTPGADTSLGHDPTNSYLLVQNSTTTVLRYSGIAGTTITFVDTITLDTAVTQGLGFVYDNTNLRYLFLDTTNNLVRRFSSTGVTVDTAAYTFDDTNAAGLFILKGRVHVAIIVANGGAATAQVQFIPTTMTI